MPTLDMHRIVLDPRFAERLRDNQPLLEFIQNRTGSQYVSLRDGSFLDIEDAANCEDCNDWVPSDEIAELNHRRNASVYYCRQCRDGHGFRCADCEEWFTEERSGGCNSNHQSICDSCSESYFYCEGCNCTMHQNEYGEDGRCTGCSRENDESEIIQDYSTDAPQKFIGNGPHYFGVELEVECNGERAEKAERVSAAVEKWAIVKEDGSLKNGFEIVTVPMSLESQLCHWPEFFKASRGLVSFETETCGLHVHCSKRPLSVMTIAKIVCFVNAEQNRKFMRCIAARNSERWAQYHAKTLPNGAKVNESRYEAVNLQNSGTIEFRIFKGTLKQASVFKAIEFCDALIRYCQPASRSLQDSMCGNGFIEFVKRGKKQWPHLWGFISAKWLGMETKESKSCGYEVKNDENQNQEEK